MAANAPADASKTDGLNSGNTAKSSSTINLTLAPKAGGELAKLLAMTYPGKPLSVEDYVKETIATIGENMSVRRTAALSVGDGLVAEYVHNIRTDLPIQVRYAPHNPANSIVVAETWSGLRLSSSHPYQPD